MVAHRRLEAASPRDRWHHLTRIFRIRLRWAQFRSSRLNPLRKLWGLLWGPPARVASNWRYGSNTFVCNKPLFLGRLSQTAVTNGKAQNIGAERFGSRGSGVRISQVAQS